MLRAGPELRRRAQVYAYTAVTTGIVLLLALAEWATEKFVSDHSRSAGIAIEIGIVLIGTLAFRPIHRRVEEAVEGAFNRRKRHALAALSKFRLELSSFSDSKQLLRRVIEAIDHHLEARATAVYVRRDAFRAEASSYEGIAEDLEPDDPLLVRLRSSGVPAKPQLLKSRAPGTHAFPMTVAGELVGFLSVDANRSEYEKEETHMLSGLAEDLAGALVKLDPRLRPQNVRPPNNLPANLAPLIGREREFGELKTTLARSHLTTITGSGGVGKTRVALQCAIDAIDGYEHGAWFIDLAPISNGSLLAATILTTLDAGPAEEGTETARLLEYLRPRQTLLVIDNCEHIVADVASLLARIYAACPHVTILATSRELLHLEGEQVYRLGPLPPQAAIELFAARAASASPGFDVHHHADAVSKICEQLDGIPLAIELAAARARALSINEILERLHERFRLLTGGSHAAVRRQQTLAATIEWSYDLLSAREQALFERLASFRGSFSLAAAAAVCGDGDSCDEFHVLDVLTSLADKSLLTVTLALTTRYRLLETIRAFAAAKAIEHKTSTLATQQHAAYFATLAAHAYYEFDSRLPAGWLERLAPDIDNFRAALTWLLEGPGDRNAGAQLAADCGPIFLRMELLGEGLRWCDAARRVLSVSPGTGGRIEYATSMMQNNLGQNDAALASAQRAVALYRESSDSRGLVRALSQEAQLFAKAHRFEEAAAPAEEAIREARALGEPRVLAGVLRRCASSLPPADIDQARALFDEALHAARAAGDRDEVCRILEWWAARESGERAIELATLALECADHSVRPYLEVSIAGYALASGRLDVAEPHAREALVLAIDTNHPLLRALAIAYWAPFLAQRLPEEAARLFGYARRQLHVLEWNGEEDDRLALETALRVIAGALSEADLESLLHRGSGLRHEEALAMLAPALASGDAANHSSIAAGDGVGTLLR
ncbi:MAG TPA: NB-ARC domain-containing protein [Verrucomicrobiae bacterium]|nr:NB-ARC domain-containing protein [Verrucomicrobiae bacterium]